MASLFSVFRRTEAASGVEVVSAGNTTVTEIAESPVRTYTLTDGHYTASPAAVVTDVRTVSPLRSISPTRVVLPTTVVEEVRSPAYLSTPLSAQVHRAPIVEDRVVVRDVSPVRLVNPIRLAAPPVFASAAPAVRVSSPVRRLPPSYSTPVVSTRVAEYPTTRTYDTGYSASYAPSVPLLRNGKAFQTSSDRVIASAAASAAAAGFMRIGDEYFPTDNYRASSGRYYAEGRSAVPVETVSSYPTRTAIVESYPSLSVPVTVADIDGRLASSARCLPEISARDQYDRYVELRNPTKMRHPSRESYTQFRETLPPKPVISS